MSNPSGPVYELTFSIDRDIVDECDRWLENHVRSMLHTPGVVDCNTAAMTDDDDGHARRMCLYELESDDALDEFLDGPGGDIDNEFEAQFPSGVRLEARILREDRRQDLTGGSPDCLNCGSYLRGQYCAVCGQRSSGRLISLWELIRDAFGDLFEIDSRLWRTLIPLLIRPGRLTHDYLQGRRARYMPPFRMYLVMSLLFFVVAFFDPRNSLGFLYEPEPEAPAPTEQELEELKLDDDDSITDGECNVGDEDFEDMPAWLQRRLTPERVNQVCERIKADEGKSFLNNLLDNVPAALIILLPLMAFVLKALYPLSRRYYVEHLLFFVHFHAFFFLILTLQILLIRLGALLGLPEAAPVLAVVASSFYIPVYLFVSMRRVYDQGRLITGLKYLALLIAYFFGFNATMLGALAIAAFSV